MLKTLLKDVFQVMYYRQIEKQQLKQQAPIAEYIPYRATKIGFGSKL